MSIRLFNANLTCTSTLNVTQPQKNIGIAPATFLVSSFFTCSDFVGITKVTTVTLTAFDLGITYSPSTSYSVSIPYGFFVDSSGNPMPGTTLTYTTPSTGPTFNTSNPMPGTSSYGGTNITINFNRWVDRGTTGSIKLYNSSGLVHSFAITDTTNITFVNGSVVVNLFQYLRDNTNYYVTIDAGCVIDEYKFTNSAITASNVIYFTTGNNYTLGLVPNPMSYIEDTVQTINPYIQIVDAAFVDSTGYTLTITPSDVQAVISLSVPTGQASSSFNSATKVLTLNGTRAQINNSLQNISLTPGGNFTNNFGISYALTTPRSTQISKTQLINFNGNIETTFVAGGILSSGQAYNNQTTSQAFYGCTITDLDPTGAQFTITLTSTNSGMFSINYSNPNSVFTYTGTKTQVNSVFSTILYHGMPGGTTDTIIYHQVKSTDTSESLTTNNTYTIALSKGTGITPNTGTYLTPGTYTLNLPFDDFYYGLISMELVGGGGGGNASTPGGGGGGGGYCYINNLALPGISNGSYTVPSPSIVVGAGGSLGSYGGDTTAFGYIAKGGAPGGSTNSANSGGTANQGLSWQGGASGAGGLSPLSYNYAYAPSSGDQRLLESAYNAKNHVTSGIGQVGAAGAGANGSNAGITVPSGSGAYTGNLEFWVPGPGITSNLLSHNIFGSGGAGGGNYNAGTNVNNPTLDLLTENNPTAWTFASGSYYSYHSNGARFTPIADLGIIEIFTVGSGYGNLQIFASSYFYSAGDYVIIPGNYLNGTTPTNDCKITIINPSNSFYSSNFSITGSNAYATGTIQSNNYYGHGGSGNAVSGGTNSSDTANAGPGCVIFSIVSR